jgi:hypothetical protein
MYMFASGIWKLHSRHGGTALMQAMHRRSTAYVRPAKVFWTDIALTD